jgi:ferredoxin
VRLEDGKGEVERQQPQYVDEAAASKGFALLCSTYPRSDLVLVTHQEQALFEEEIGDYGRPDTAASRR